MKKSLISLAVATGLMAAGAAQAGSTAYGFIDLAITKADSDTAAELVSTTSAIGLKGSEDLGDGMKAIYKVELQVDVADRAKDGDSNQILDRDQFVGLKGGMGTVKLGVMSNNWKQMGSKIDPFYRTPFQMRSNGQQSVLHKGAGLNGGRSIKTIQYASPKMGGIQMVANTTVSGDGSQNTSGIGFRYSNKMVTAWLDYLTVGDSGANSSAADESATKIGARIKATKALVIGLQLEQTEDLLGADVTSLSATYAIDKSNKIAFTWGETDSVVSGFNLGLWHKLSKKTSVYVAYNDTSDETGTPGSPGDDSAYALGIRKKF